MPFPFPPATTATADGKVIQLGPNDAVLLRVEEAAERLGISRAQIFRLIASGQLSSVKIGASRRVPVRSLESFVDDLISHQH